MTKAPAVEIGVFGGSGFYNFVDVIEERWIETPYGAPSDKVIIGEVNGRRVAFLPRHGRDHQLPPHMINYRANVWAMHSLGVGWIIGPCAAGSLQAHVKPGEFVISDQYVDRTNARKDTFYEGPIATHIGQAEPFCPTMRKLAIDAAVEEGIPHHTTGTIVIINGPRFSTKSESKWFAGQGWEVINMTNYPENVLCRELEMSYCNIALITDYDVGLEGHPDVKPVTHEDVVKVFLENNDKLRGLLFRLIAKLPEPSKRPDFIKNALQGARLG
ncbi:MAG: S-methyl-5'-thioadenosine phosphorylase [bacterium]